MMPVREDRLSVFIKYAHIPEGKAKGHQLRMSWAIISLLVTGRPCPALCSSRCRNGLAPGQASPESARGTEVGTAAGLRSLGAGLPASSGVTCTGVGALKCLACVCLSAQ